VIDRPEAVLGAIDAEAVAERTARCRSVARLSGGLVGEVATYLPGRRVRGVRLAEDGSIEIHVVACWGVRVPELAAEVRDAVGPIAAGLPINVHVDDVDVPGGGEGTEIFLPDGS
jgi:uncharacterized alkaline shock family protein YloU